MLTSHAGQSAQLWVSWAGIAWREGLLAQCCLVCCVRPVMPNGLGRLHVSWCPRIDLASLFTAFALIGNYVSRGPSLLYALRTIGGRLGGDWTECTCGLDWADRTPFEKQSHGT